MGPQFIREQDEVIKDHQKKMTVGIGEQFAEAQQSYENQIATLKEEIQKIKVRFLSRLWFPSAVFLSIVWSTHPSATWRNSKFDTPTNTRRFSLHTRRSEWRSLESTSESGTTPQETTGGVLKRRAGSLNKGCRFVLIAFLCLFERIKLIGQCHRLVERRTSTLDTHLNLSIYHTHTPRHPSTRTILLTFAFFSFFHSFPLVFHYPSTCSLVTLLFCSIEGLWSCQRWPTSSLSPPYWTTTVISSRVIRWGEDRSPWVLLVTFNVTDSREAKQTSTWSSKSI